ncbi:phasin family protein [Methylobacterium nigriterrae]|uniref:phasin family protein n=1 Tax=Methylobacterium nigriterrae TaxID=3127512 RepID=UPI003013224A
MTQATEKTEAALKTGMDAVMKSFGAASKTAQTIGVEWVDFTKQSFEHTVATAEKLAKAGTLGKAMEIQAEYVKGSYERGLAQAATLRDLYAALAKDVAKPFEGLTLTKAA